ncbi:MAG: hypothetical protein A4E25_01872 [Methanobacterium sp. PtaB.Bin024]|jgi:uncharacterized protein YneF (UPF0154 family)|nr:MAG: hypothetical protein A4E25_01872 [Methanobacterium sp. PtaB.Bin024]
MSMYVLTVLGVILGGFVVVSLMTQILNRNPA